MKKIVSIIFILLFIIIFLGTANFLYQKSQEKPVVFETEQAQEMDIISKTVATGKIIPRQEVEIKSQVSGVVDTLYTEAGEIVKSGDLIAKIRIIPDIARLNNAETQLLSAEINFKDSRRERDRQKSLYQSKLISEFDYNRFVLDYNLKKEALSAARSNLAIVRDGAAKSAGNSSKTSNIVYSTLDGMVLDIPVKKGAFITETNTFNPGTTIAAVANMQDLIFEGSVDEAEVGKIREGMELILNIGALEQNTYTAILEFISPKGFDEQGTIKFQIKAAVKLQEGTFIRAGYSANADIVLEKRENVLAINEGLLQFDGDQTYVEVERAEQVFERINITTGLSDSIFIEVKDGLSKDDKIKVPLVGAAAGTKSW